MQDGSVIKFDFGSAFFSGINAIARLQREIDAGGRPLRFSSPLKANLAFKIG
jgi:hypothetical protein